MAGAIKRFLIKVGLKKEQRYHKLGPIGGMTNPVTGRATPLFVRWRNGESQITSDTRRAKHKYPKDGARKGK
jgi:hypothetical protein